jgi:hypothetical protein
MSENSYPKAESARSVDTDSTYSMIRVEALSDSWNRAFVVTHMRTRS